MERKSVSVRAPTSNHKLSVVRYYREVEIMRINFDGVTETVQEGFLSPLNLPPTTTTDTVTLLFYLNLGVLSPL